MILRRKLMNKKPIAAAARAAVASIPDKVTLSSLPVGHIFHYVTPIGEGKLPPVAVKLDANTYQYLDETITYPIRGGAELNEVTDLGKASWL